MDLHFERGRSDAPAGHALMYFTRSGAVVATYIVVLPITLDLSKYVPPMLAGQIPLPDAQAVNAVPLPPMPEEVESRALLDRLAALRTDDLINGGSLPPGDLGRAMTSVADLAARYTQLYTDYLKRELAQAPETPAEPAPTLEPVSDLTANDMIYELMSEQQKLGELSKLAGQLRYAVEGNDQRQVEDLAGDVERLARYLPTSYELPKFLESAKRSDAPGQLLASLYLERCYKIASHDYAALGTIDEQIRRLKESSAR